MRKEYEGDMSSFCPLTASMSQQTVSSFSKWQLSPIYGSLTWNSLPTSMTSRTTLSGDHTQEKVPGKQETHMSCQIKGQWPETDHAKWVLNSSHQILPRVVPYSCLFSTKTVAVTRCKIAGFSSRKQQKLGVSSSHRDNQRQTH